MFFFSKNKDVQASIEEKEVLIQKNKALLHHKIERDVRAIEKINQKLGNGITLRIHHASGGHRG